MNNPDDWNQHWSDLYQSSQYNPAQAFRRELLIRWLKKQAMGKESHVLDIGCGQGDLIASLVRIFPDTAIAGVEGSAIGVEQSQAKSQSARFFQRDLQVAPVSDDALLNWATLAVCCEVLEHVDQPAEVLENAVQYLKPGARIFITVPGGPMSAFDRHIGHRRHFNKTSLDQLIRKAGLVPERVTGIGFPFFNLYRLTVILRGKALIKDTGAETNQGVFPAARIAMKVFSLVLKCHLNSASMGWQMIGIARKPL